MNREQPVGIAEAAHRVKCSEWTLRRLDYRGIVRPSRDPWGRRLYTVDDLESARRYLNARRARRMGNGNG